MNNFKEFTQLKSAAFRACGVGMFLGVLCGMHAPDWAAVTYGFVGIVVAMYGMAIERID